VSEYRLTPRAEEDLRAIWRSIASDSEQAADGLLLRIFDKLERAAQFPEMGVPRPELSPTTRLLVEGRYVVIYEPMPYGILAIAIVHGMRDPASWLG
jgi:toxin ParE1/3/4